MKDTPAYPMTDHEFTYRNSGLELHTIERATDREGVVWERRHIAYNAPARYGDTNRSGYTHTGAWYRPSIKEGDLK